MKQLEATCFDWKFFLVMVKCCFLYFLLSIVSTHTASAQIIDTCANRQASAIGGFTFSPITGCAPLDVTFTDTSGGGNIKYYIKDPNGNYAPASTLTSNLFALPGKYTIRQVGSKGTCMTADRDITVLDRAKPVFSLKTCANREAELSLSNPIYDQYTIDWGDGNQDVILKAAGSIHHTYVSAATYTVSVTGKYTSGCTSDPETATIISLGSSLPKPVVNRLEVKSETAAELQFTTLADFTYKVFKLVNNTGNQEIGTVANVAGLQTLPINGLNTNANGYSFRVVAFDACGNQSPADLVYTIKVQAQPEDNRNKVQWNSYTGGGAQYGIIKNKAAAFPTSASPYYDTDVQCLRSYCYRIVATVGSFQSISGESCVTATSSTVPPAVTDLLVTIDGGKPSLSWQLPAQFPLKNATITRSENGSAFITLAQIKTNQYIDKNADASRNRYCYRVTYSDSCGNTSPNSEDVCPIVLTLVENPNAYQLAWTPYEQWPGGVDTYTVELLDTNGIVVASTARGLALDFLDEELNTTQQLLLYRVKAVEAGGLARVSYSNMAEIRQEVRVFLPDAFTPNGNTLNETFGAKGLFIKNFFMQIYNRWGELVFTTKAISEEWDGTKEGQPVPPGTYVYKVEVVDFFGRIVRKSKNFILIR